MSGVDSVNDQFKRFMRPRGWLLVPAAGTLIVLYWTFWPSMAHPYVQIASSELQFKLSCAPAEINIEVANSYARARGAQVDLISKATLKTLSTVALQTSGAAAENGLPLVRLIADRDKIGSLLTLSGQQKDPTEFKYTVFFERIPSLNVRAIEFEAGSVVGGQCSMTRFRGTELLSVVAGHSSRLMRHVLIQDNLSSAVLAFNNVVANFILGGMVVAFLWFTYIAGAGFWYLYVTREAKLLKLIEERFNLVPAPLAIQGKIAMVEADFNSVNRRLGFAKALGPAIGFMLTVSSLSAALHPSVQAVQDTFRFVSGIQIAVIATFMGLAIRIVAQFAQRWHRDLGERKLVLLRFGMGAEPGGAHAEKT